jgi:hypothetical protein
MPLTSLREFLDRHNVSYIVMCHSPAYTAQGVAALAHIPGKELAKNGNGQDGRFVGNGRSSRLVSC